MKDEEYEYLEQHIPDNCDIVLAHRPLADIMDGVVTRTSPYTPVKQVGIPGIEDILKQKKVKMK